MASRFKDDICSLASGYLSHDIDRVLIAHVDRVGPQGGCQVQTPRILTEPRHHAALSTVGQGRDQDQQPDRSRTDDGDRFPVNRDTLKGVECNAEGLAQRRHVPSYLVGKGDGLGHRNDDILSERAGLLCTEHQPVIAEVGLARLAIQTAPALLDGIDRNQLPRSEARDLRAGADHPPRELMAHDQRQRRMVEIHDLLMPGVQR
jgi:hypothetical protein